MTQSNPTSAAPAPFTACDLIAMGETFPGYFHGYSRRINGSAGTWGVKNAAGEVVARCGSRAEARGQANVMTDAANAQTNTAAPVALPQPIAAHLSTMSDGDDTTHGGIVWTRLGDEFKASPHGSEGDYDTDCVWFDRSEVLNMWDGGDR